MADFTDLPNLAVGVGGLPSGTTVTALRDNPVAIAEGATGAPRVRGSAQVDNLLASFTVTSPANSFVLTDIEPHTTLLIEAVDFLLSEGGSNSKLLVQVSGDNGASYSSDIDFLGTSEFNARTSFAVFEFPSGRAAFCYGVSTLTASNNAIIPHQRLNDANFQPNAVRFRDNNPGNTLAQGTFNVYGRKRAME